MPSISMLWSRRTLRDSLNLKQFSRFYSQNEPTKKASKMKSFSIYRFVS